MKRFLKICVIVVGIIALQSFLQEDRRQNFVRQAALANKFEVALAEQAINRSSSAAIQDLAKVLVADHQQLISELEAYANANELNMPADLDQQYQRKLQSLAELDKGAYDRVVKETLIDAHERSISLFEDASSDDKILDEELKKWMNEKLPTLKSHLEQSKGLSVEMSTLPRTMPPIGSSFQKKLK
jgi:putative membrane protein